MTKKLVAISLAIALVITLGLAPVAYAAPPSTQLDSVDIGDTTSEAGHSVSFPDWGPTEGVGNRGGYGSIDDCRVVWHAGEIGDEADNRCATLTLSWSEGKARHIELRVLDGFADDSFKVYVMNPGGNWALVYSYTDTPPAWDSEAWDEHHIYSFPAGKGQGNIIEMKIEATGPAWASFSTYGQLAVDYVEVYNH